MNNREKVIKDFETEIMNFTPSCTSDELLKEIMETALELLKEQEPLIIRKESEDEIYNYIAECPECGTEWAMCHSEKMRFCPGCGKAVKWDA